MALKTATSRWQWREEFKPKQNVGLIKSYEGKYRSDLKHVVAAYARDGIAIDAHLSAGLPSPQEIKQAAAAHPEDSTPANTAASTRADSSEIGSAKKHKADADMPNAAPLKRVRAGPGPSLRQQAISGNVMGLRAATETKQARKRTRDRGADDGREQKKTKFDEQPLKGLSNHKEACFSNVVIQLLDAATEGHDLDQMFGPLEQVESFSTKTESVNKSTNKQTATRLRQRRRRSFARPSRRLPVLARTPSSAGTVSPDLFQMVFAFGTTSGDAKERHAMSGNSQEGSFECYQKLLQTLCYTPQAQSADELRALFEVSTSTTDLCSNGCGQDTAPQLAVNNYHSITVPSRTSTERPQDLQSLLEDSMNSHSEQSCDTCKNGIMRKVTQIRAAPEQLVVKVDRAQYDLQKMQVSESKAEVDLLPATTIQVAEQQYEVIAAVMHKGSTPQRGHYAIYRKHAGAWWLLDDSSVTRVSRQAVKDGNKTGQSAVLLLKKVHE